MQKIENNELNLSSRLLEKYGELMRLSEVATELKFPTADAVRKSLSRGALNLTVIRLPRRREVFIKTSEVVKFLQQIE